ncbi:MAG: type II toxin-antitoxin system VapC family toxin [Chloroflexi bacterium]|nr:type II toxin-antitoxin system VapC family toxin [Chloroflexota bacterium]MBK6710967.1 type II toxin-antitoxin system VapC family toxin [Chloroflexota bacterium]MBK7176653.1 type II toxin-antitoxin system VapC family toxin [Chloroflexota bacterium]MBK8935016.1 type II toxin-antitoxin system VapC family toxin [Chloroflexota bacterium]MBP7593934.1 type II toxin-antitoxin system VapC family toxin [Chloroflexota bacterium]
MANVVVDASVLIAVVTNEAEKARLVQLTQDVDLIAPHSIRWEIGNAFSAMLKRRRITVEDAIRAIELYQKIPVRFVDVEIEEAIRLADALNIYAYDAYLVRCAIKYNSPLLSLDEGLVQSAKSAKAQVLEVTA